MLRRAFRGLAKVLRRLTRRRVPAGGNRRWPGDGGSAGVREPRRPRPSGPVAGGAAHPQPADPIVSTLPDPRD